MKQKGNKMEVISIKDFIGAEVRSRSNAKTLRKQLDNNHSRTVDMEGVTFISRSFADELYNISHDYGHVNFINRNNTVKSTMDAVWASRKKKRIRPNKEARVEEVSTMEDLFNFLMET
jgi:hypothetical protein